MLVKLLRRLKAEHKARSTAGPQDISTIPPASQPTDEEKYVFPDVKPSREQLPLQNPTAEWQLPLPPDVILLILDYYLQDITTVYNLSLACSSLAKICRPYRLSTVSLNIQSRVTVEDFAWSLRTYPDRIGLIQTFHITGDNPPWYSTSVDERLCFILTRPYPKLKRLELSIGASWASIPSQFQDAFQVLFARPALREVIFDRMQISVEMLAYLPQIFSLEIRGDISWPPQPSSGICVPTRLLICDRTPGGHVIHGLFYGNSPLKLTKLKQMEAYVANLDAGALAIPLRMCATTLTSLHLYTGKRNSVVPSSINLGSLTQLEDILLTCDLTEAPRYRFSRVLNTLSRLGPDPYPVRNLMQITIILRKSRLGFTKYPRWELLDALFAPSLDVRWPKLSKVNIRIVTEDRSDERWYVQGSTEKKIQPLMPILYGAGVLNIHASVEALDSWHL
ncbi:hypothetical protein NLJ89_g5987 [Agrocybe chaxingu]|uniref:Uncharacterized protein n=1 Tax=Agrocybe chaxingu TaxID=84603 RepID=A0A9W8JZR5_9AGAR|nr:hypothetical protein NLJ89_g5987 [Agrocybe chaxingu]